MTQHYYPFSWQAHDDDNNEHVCHYWICFQHKFPGNVYVTLLTVIKIRKYNGYKKNSQWNKLADKSAIRINRINTVVTNLPGVNKNNRTLIQLIYRFEIVQTYTWKCTYKNLHTSVCSDISALLFFFFFLVLCVCMRADEGIVPTTLSHFGLYSCKAVSTIFNSLDVTIGHFNIILHIFIRQNLKSTCRIQNYPTTLSSSDIVRESSRHK